MVGRIHTTINKLQITEFKQCSRHNFFKNALKLKTIPDLKNGHQKKGHFAQYYLNGLNNIVYTNGCPEP